MINTILDIFTEYYWYILLTHFVLSVALFFIVNWIGARAISIGYMQMDIVIQEDSAPAFNFLFKVLAPVVFIILCAVGFEALGIPQFNNNIYFPIEVFLWHLLPHACRWGRALRWVHQKQCTWVALQ